MLACAWEGFFTDSVLLLSGVTSRFYSVYVCVRLIVNSLGLHYSLFVSLMTVSQISYVYRGQISIVDSWTLAVTHFCCPNVSVSSWVWMSCQPYRVTSERITHSQFLYTALKRHQLCLIYCHTVNSQPSLPPSIHPSMHCAITHFRCLFIFHRPSAREASALVSLPWWIWIQFQSVWATFVCLWLLSV